MLSKISFLNLLLLFIFALIADISGNGKFSEIIAKILISWFTPLRFGFAKNWVLKSGLLEIFCCTFPLIETPPTAENGSILEATLTSSPITSLPPIAISPSWIPILRFRSLMSLEASGEKVHRDAFGHVRLDEINPGVWFANKLSNEINADKVLIQKSGYFSRSAPSNSDDLELIFKSVEMAIECALSNRSGVIGIDEVNDKLSCIDFSRIKGGKPFNISLEWYQNMMQEIHAIK